MDTTLEDVERQVRDAGVNPKGPIFVKYAKKAPTDIEFYDQVTWAINKTREEIESNQAEERQEEVEKISLDDALEAESERIL